MLTVRLERLDVRPGHRVLDLGCGEGRHVHALSIQPGVEVFGLDLCFDDVRETRTRLDGLADMVPDTTPRAGLVVGDALRLPFADGAFDRVICSEVLEHIPDYESALKEITRVLAPGGTLAVSVPRYGPERVCWALSDAYHEVEGGHVRIFRASSLRRAIEARGFEHTGRHWAHALHSPYWWLQCALWNRRERSALVRLYRRFLEWDLIDRPRLTRALERALDPLLGKSVVLYFHKPA